MSDEHIIDTGKGSFSLSELGHLLPGMAEIMPLVGDRIWKCYYAGMAKNQKLARFQLKEAVNLLEKGVFLLGERPQIGGGFDPICSRAQQHQGAHALGDQGSNLQRHMPAAGASHYGGRLDAQVVQQFHDVTGVRVGPRGQRGLAVSAKVRRDHRPPCCELVALPIPLAGVGRGGVQKKQRRS